MGIKRHYEINESPFGYLSETEIKEGLTPEQYEKLMEHAFVFANLDGNCFPGCISQYLPEAYHALWSGSALDHLDLPLLYPCTAVDAWYLRLPKNHSQYDDMPELRRDALRQQIAAFLGRNNDLLRD